MLYNGMASTSSWAALYFIALMTFGNYVLFNLLVAILVEGFQAEVNFPARSRPLRLAWEVLQKVPIRLGIGVGVGVRGQGRRLQVSGSPSALGRQGGCGGIPGAKVSC